MAPKRKSKTLEQVKQHLRKNKIGALIVAALLLAGLYVLFSESRSPEQARAIEGMEATVAKFAEVSGGLRNVLRKQWGFVSSDNRTKAATLWASMNSFQREQEVLEVLEKLRNGPFQKAAQDLGTTDMVRMFHVACPDVVGKEFHETPSKLWNLMDAWFKGSSQDGMSGDARQSLEEVIKHGFWSGIDKLDFSDDDVHKFSALGWNGIRDVVLGIFFKGLGPNIVAKQDRIAKGETGVLPEAPVPWSAEPEAQAVVHLTEGSFSSGMTKKHMLVMFYAPWCGHCKSFKPHLIQAAQRLQPYEDVGVGAVDCTTERELARHFNITAYPTIALFVDGERQPVEFDAERSTYGVVKFLNKATGGTLGELEAALKPEEERPWSEVPSDVVHLTDDSFSKVTEQKHAVVMFYAPWCGHCKAFKPTFMEVATKLKGKALVAAIDGDEARQTSAKYEVKGYPTVLLFREGNMIETYQGPRDTASVVSWAAGHVDKAEL